MAAEPEDEDSWLYGDDSSAKTEQRAGSGETKSNGRGQATRTAADNVPELLPEAGADDERLCGATGNVASGNRSAEAAGADVVEVGEDDEEEESEIESDDSDDDIKVTIREIQTTASYINPTSASLQRAARSSATNVQPIAPPSSTAPAAAKGLDLDVAGKINGVNTYEFDLDSVDDKPWRKPGADLTDYFNYGFSEDTWKQYCEKQRRLRMENGPAPIAMKAYEVRDMKMVSTSASTSRHYRGDTHDDQDGRHTPEENSSHAPVLPSAAEVVARYGIKLPPAIAPPPAVQPPAVPKMDVPTSLPLPPSSVGAPPFALPPQAMAALGIPPPGALLPPGVPRQPPPFGLPPHLPGVPRLPLPPHLGQHPPRLPGLPPFEGSLALPPGLPPKLPHVGRPETGSEAGRADIHTDRPPLFLGDGLFSGAPDGLQPPPGLEGAFTGDMSLGEAFAALAYRRAAASRSRSRSPPPYGQDRVSRSPSRGRTPSRTPSPVSGMEDDRRYDSRHYPRETSRRPDRGGGGGGGDYHRHHRPEYPDPRDARAGGEGGGRDRRERAEPRDRDRDRDREREREYEARRRYHERERRDDKDRDRYRERERDERDRRERRDDDRSREDRDRDERSRHDEKEKEREYVKQDERERPPREERDGSKREDDKRRERKRRRSGTPGVEEQQPRKHKRSKASKEKA